MLTAPLQAAALSITVAWDAVSHKDAGYIVYVRTPASSKKNFDVGSATTFTMPDTQAGVQYCFSVATYIPGPLVGPPSGEVCGYADAPPTLKYPGNITSYQGIQTSLQLQGSDPDGRAVSYSAIGLPSGLALIPSTGQISGTPTQTGSHTVVATVDDGLLTASQSFGWRVLIPSTPPPDEPDPEPERDPEPEPEPPVPGPPSLSVLYPVASTSLSVRTSITALGGEFIAQAGLMEISWANGSMKGVAMTSGNVWLAAIPLTKGDNAITVTVKDKALQTTSVKVTVRY